jgi:transposase
MAWHQGQAYGQDLRDRVLNANGSIAEVAIRFKVSKSYVARARSRKRRLGDDSPGAQHNHVPLKLSGLEAVLAARVQATNDQTLEQLCQWLHAEHGVQVSVTTMWKTLARLELSLKKRHSMPQSRNART